MNTEIIHEVCKQSVANSLPFPDVVRRLTEAGVESYYADLIQLQKTYYAPNGEVCLSRLETEPLGPVGEQFDSAKVQEALKAIQRGIITYVEFLRWLVAAGTFAYTVHIRGRRALYLGRAGDFHVENFPPSDDRIADC
jgi:uncharacterized protein YbcV (DUF1398 family)